MKLLRHTKIYISEYPTDIRKAVRSVMKFRIILLLLLLLKWLFYHIIYANKKRTEAKSFGKYAE